MFIAHSTFQRAGENEGSNMPMTAVAAIKGPMTKAPVIAASTDCRDGFDQEYARKQSNEIAADCTKNRQSKRFHERCPTLMARQSFSSSQAGWIHSAQALIGRQCVTSERMKSTALAR